MTATLLAVQQETAAIATMGAITQVGNQTNQEGKQQPTAPLPTPLAPPQTPVYCNPNVMNAMKLAYETAQMKTILNKAQGLDDPGHQMEGGFPVYQNGGVTTVGDIGYGPATGWDPQNGATGASAVFHTHPNGSGLPSTPGNTASEGGSGDTGYAIQDQVDNYVISWNGLSVAKASGPLNPPKKGWDPWVVKGNGPGDWFKKLKAKCGSK